MLKAFVEKIAEMAAPTTYEVNGKTFASKGLSLVEAPEPSPIKIEVNGLDSVCKR